MSDLLVFKIGQIIRAWIIGASITKLPSYVFERNCMQNWHTKVKGRPALMSLTMD